MNYLKRRRAVPLRPMWTIMVAAKLDHSRVLVTKIHQNMSTLKGRSAGQRQADRETDKPVGFCGPIAPPISECPQFADLWSDNTQETQTQEMMDQNFEIRIL